MLTKEEQNFMLWWEGNRLQQKKIANQWTIGLPAGLVFGLPVLLNLFVEWNDQVPYMRRGQFNVLLIAVLLIVSFYAVFSIRHKWDLREQYYKELKAKEKNSAPPQQPAA